MKEKTKITPHKALGLKAVEKPMKLESGNLLLPAFLKAAEEETETHKTKHLKFWIPWSQQQYAVGKQVKPYITHWFNTIFSLV